MSRYFGTLSRLLLFVKLLNTFLQVYVMDVSVPLIEKWNSETLPIYEPGLDTIVKVSNFFLTATYVLFSLAQVE